MNINLVNVVYMVVVTLAGATKSENENQIISRQIDKCDVFPQMKCSSDCSSLMVCHDETAPPLILKCPTDKPFCTNGKCGKVNGKCMANTNVNENELNFVCTSDGTFPDPTNCANKYICVGLTATLEPCEPGRIYDSKLDECVRGVPRIDHASKKICKKISCDKKPNGYILFPANPAFYAYCDNHLMSLYKCDDIENQVFDIASKKCIFKCRSAGYFPDPLDCTVYYLCKGLIKFKLTTLNCATGQYFDGTTGQCVDGMDCGTTLSPTMPPTAQPTNPPITPPTSPPVTPPVTTVPFSIPRTTPRMPFTSGPLSSRDATTTTMIVSSTQSLPFLSTSPPPVTSSSFFALDYLSQSTVPNQGQIDHLKPTTTPISQSHSLWKHKGKYSIRLSKFV